MTKYPSFCWSQQVLWTNLPTGSSWCHLYIVGKKIEFDPLNVTKSNNFGHQEIFRSNSPTESGSPFLSPRMEESWISEAQRGICQPPHPKRHEYAQSVSWRQKQDLS
jgi:hypothetical protein